MLKALLNEVKPDRILYSELCDGKLLFKRAGELGLEGIVSKISAAFRRQNVKHSITSAK